MPKLFCLSQPLVKRSEIFYYRISGSNKHIQGAGTQKVVGTLLNPAGLMGNIVLKNPVSKLHKSPKSATFHFVRADYWNSVKHSHTPKISSILLYVDKFLSDYGLSMVSGLWLLPTSIICSPTNAKDPGGTAWPRSRTSGTSLCEWIRSLMPAPGFGPFM